MNNFIKFIFVFLFYTSSNFTFGQSTNKDSIFTENFLFCDFIPNSNGIKKVHVLPGRLWVENGIGKYWKYTPNSGFSSSNQYTYELIVEEVNGLSETRSLDRNIRVQNVGDQHTKTIFEDYYYHSWGPGSECFFPSFSVIDHNKDSTSSYTINLEMGSDFYPARKVIYNLKDTYFIYSIDNGPSYCQYAQATESSHFLSYNELTEEINLVEIEIPVFEFFVNNKNQVFFSSSGASYYRLYDDLSYEEVLLKPNGNFLGRYGSDEFIFYTEGRLEIYNDALTNLISSIEFPGLTNLILTIEDKDIYHYSSGTIKKIDENFDEEIVFQVTDLNEKLPDIKQILKLGNRFCLAGNMDGANYLHVFDDTIESLTCNPIDECTKIELENITPISMKATFKSGGQGQSNAYQYYAMSLNADIEITNYDTTAINSISLEINNTNFSEPLNGNPLFTSDDFFNTYVSSNLINILPGETKKINLNIPFKTYKASAYYDFPPLIEYYEPLDEDVILFVVTANEYKPCVITEIRFDPQEVFPFLDQDCDGFFIHDDCNDLDSLVNPLMTEILDNEIDDNCNGVIDEINSSTTNEYIQLKTSPNPTSGIVLIDHAPALFNFEIFNVNGNYVLEGRSDNSTIDLSSLDNGIYFIRLSTKGNAQIYFQKIIKI